MIGVSIVSSLILVKSVVLSTLTLTFVGAGSIVVCTVYVGRCGAANLLIVWLIVRFMDWPSNFVASCGAPSPSVLMQHRGD